MTGDDGVAPSGTGEGSVSLDLGELLDQVGWKDGLQFLQDVADRHVQPAYEL